MIMLSASTHQDLGTVNVNKVSNNFSVGFYVVNYNSIIFIYNEGSQKLLQQLWKALFMISVYSSGFRSIGVPPWPDCFNINECMEGTHNCVDPFLFVGYTGNGTFCEDIDECVTDTDNCASESTCSNSPGGFTCLCNTGFTGDGVHCTGTQSCNIFTCFNHSSIM